MKSIAVVHEKPVKIVRPLLAAFVSYIEKSLRRDFHAVRLLKGGGPPAIALDKPLVVYLNHASWWDPLMMMWLGKICYPDRSQYGPIEASQLKRYSFFKYLGVFGVQKGSLSGARKFLRISKQILGQPGAMLWLTPQGRFADVRERPVKFASGIAHLASLQKEVAFVPLAIEYGFGQEKYPEIFLCFGKPVDSHSLGVEAQKMQDLLEGALDKTLTRLSKAVIERDDACFETMLSGKGGASLPYDLWRRLRALWRREAPNLNHGQVS